MRSWRLRSPPAGAPLNSALDATATACCCSCTRRHSVLACRVRSTAVCCTQACVLVSQACVLLC